MPDAAPTSKHHTNAVALTLAIAWLIGFGVWFNSFAFPNNPKFSRGDVWLLLLVGSDEEPKDDDASSWRNFSQRFDLLAVAAAIVVSAAALGRLLLRGLKIGESLTRIERLVFAVALGLAGLSLMTLGAGMAGLLNRWLFRVVLSALVTTELLISIESRSRTRHVAGAPNRGDRRIAWACAIAIAPFLAVMLLGAMLPSFDFDVKEYHLQGPKEFYQNGRVEFLPHNVYTSFPFLTEMLSLLAMVLRDDWFRGALAGKAVLMTFAPITALALYAAGRRYFSETAGWLAALIYLSTPWTYRVSIIAYAEGALTCYLFVSLFALMLAIERLRESGERKAESGAMNARWALLVGLLAGCAMACKYPGAVQVVIPIGLALIIAAYSSCRCVVKSLRTGGVFAVGVAIAVGPWLVKNTVETGNPVYPLLGSVFGGRDWDAELNAKWKAAHSPDNHHAADLAEKFIDVIAKSDWLSPLLFGLAPLTLLAAFRSRSTDCQSVLPNAIGGRKRVCLLWLYVAYLFLAWWGLTHRIDRFWIPMIPVVALLAGAGATWSRHRIWVVVATLAFAATIAFNVRYVTTPLCGYNGYFTDLSTARRQSEQTAPGIMLVNRLPEDAKVLSVGDAQVFDARRSIIYNTVFDRSIFEEWFGDGHGRLRSADEIRERLRAEGITHVYVNWDEILRYRPTYGYTDFVTPRKFEVLQQIGVLDEPVEGGFRKWTRLSKRQRAEVLRWGPELKSTVNGRPVVRRFAVYPVAAE